MPVGAGTQVVVAPDQGTAKPWTIRIPRHAYAKLKDRAEAAHCAPETWIRQALEVLAIGGCDPRATLELELWERSRRVL